MMKENSGLDIHKDLIFPSDNPHCLYSGEQNPLERIYLTQFATKMRNFADEDYISARTLFRTRQYRNFVYMSVQCIEKYFKSILLFIEKEAPPTHNLIKLYELVSKQSELKLSVRSVKFIREINGLDGIVRYANASYYWFLEWLLELDYFVHDIRPYCVTRFVDPNFFEKGLKISVEYMNIQPGHKLNTQYIIPKGLLEAIVYQEGLTERKSKSYKEMRVNLIWNNPFFGRNKKRKVWRYKGSRSVNIHPISRYSKHSKKYFDYLSQFFHFHPDINNFFNFKRKRERKNNK